MSVCVVVHTLLMMTMMMDAVGSKGFYTSCFLKLNGESDENIKKKAHQLDCA
jgi:hypothetical protein